MQSKRCDMQSNKRSKNKEQILKITYLFMRFGRRLFACAFLLEKGYIERALSILYRAGVARLLLYRHR